MTGLLEKLSACRCAADASPILESIRASPSQRKLVETGIALLQNRDPNQKRIGEDFIKTALQETGHDSVTPKPAEVGSGASDVDKLTEEEVPSGTGTAGSEQSSKITQPYPKEGTDEPNSDIESMQTASGEDQMGKISEGMPPMMPGMDPMVAQQMAGQMPPMPQMNTPQIMKQMQYTVQEALKPYRNEISRLRSAVSALDSQIKEIQTNKGAMTLDIQSVKENAIVSPHPVQETTIPGTDITVPTRTFPVMKLEETRRDMTELDKMLSMQ